MKLQTLYKAKWLYPKELIGQDLHQACSNSIQASILNTNNIKTTQDIQYYLKDYQDSIQLVSPDELPNISQAIEKIITVIKNKGKIVIFGDYDVDGTTSTALLIDVFRALNAECDYYIPNRFDEGYGLNNNAIDIIKNSMQTDLLITCDCGITNIKEVEYSNSLNLDVIITDHHSLPDNLPPAYAIVNPKMLNSNHALYWLPGVGVAYKLAVKLLQYFKKESLEQSLLDLVALGIIADLAPLRSENRLLALQGLRQLANTNRTGLQALLKEAGFQFDEEAVGFQIAPRINAAGRLADARDAVQLFLSDCALDATVLAQELTNKNIYRQELCDQIYKEALILFEQDKAKNPDIKVIMLANTNWHHGVIGIVASRLVEKFHLPVFMASIEENKIKGSARSIKGIDLFNEMTEFDKLFDKYGGHTMAAGYSMSLDNWQLFKQQLTNNLGQKLNNAQVQKKYTINRVLTADELNLNTVNIINNLAPYGVEFARPQFTLNQACKVINIKPLGKKGEHLKYCLEINNQKIEALQWRMTLKDLPPIDNEYIRILFKLGINKFRNTESLQLEIVDWLPMPIEDSEQMQTLCIFHLRALWQYIQEMHSISSINYHIADLIQATGLLEPAIIELLNILSNLQYIEYSIQIIGTTQVITIQITEYNIQSKHLSGNSLDFSKFTDYLCAK